MQFNRYLFDLYVESDGGRAAIRFFNDLPRLIDAGDGQALDDFFGARLPGTFPVDYWQEQVTVAQEDLALFAAELMPTDISERGWDDAFLSYMDAIIEQDIASRDLLTWLPALSLAFHCLVPLCFFPYAFVERFFVLEAVAESFALPLPPLPKMRDYRGRLEYYLDLCRVWYDFARRWQMTPVELAAFLYDFAPQMSDVFIQAGDLPQAANVYLCGGSKEDYMTVKQGDKNHQYYWQGNPQTMVGDIVLLYTRSPYSAINGIFRAYSSGYFDPFSYYGNRVWLGSPILVPAVSLSALKENAVWGKKGLLHANMQGVNGRAVSAAEYQALLDLLIAKGMDVASLPTLLTHRVVDGVTLTNERDVEVHLLEPLLRQLGFADDDWQRQLALRMGRGERVYPDYALLANNQRGAESARFIWEAKYRISHDYALEDAFYQAKSYALRLSARGLGLVAVDGLWVSLAAENFAFAKRHYFSWSSLAQADHFAKLWRFAGYANLSK